MTLDYKSMSDDELLKAYKETEVIISTNHNLQMALKILLNSGYGALANNNFIYSRVENAESITTSGQLVNIWTSDRINDLLKSITGIDKRFVFYNDTDSAYIDCDDIVKELGLADCDDLNKVVDELDNIIRQVVSPAIDTFTQDLCDYMNHYENKMVWEREVISPSSIFIAKKRYVMLVIDSEGVRYSKPKLKITGLESKRSSTPQWAKDSLNECYKLAVLDKRNEMYDFIGRFEKNFYKLSPSDIAIPTGVNGIEKYSNDNGYYIKGTPKNVKAAINHNNLVQKLNLKQIQTIQSGNKMKYVDLIKPNPINEEVIGFTSGLPPEFKLDKYVDYKEAYYKGFEKPLQNFLNAIGWTTEPIIELF